MSDISSDEDTPPKRLQAKKPKLYIRRKQKFLKDWLNDPRFNTWLMPDSSDKYKAKCRICDATFTAELTVIKNHGKCKSHISAIDSTSNQKSIQSFTQKRTEQSLDYNATRAEIKLCGFLAEHNLPFRLMDHLTPLLKDCFPDSKIVQDIRLKSSKSSAVVMNVIGATEKQDLSMKLKSVLFSVLIDESTDISKTQNLCIVVRFYNSEEGKVTSRFWELYQIFNEEDNSPEASAQHIFNCIQKSFEKYSIPFTNIIGFGSDGCSTMMGDKNSVRTRFEQSCPGIYIMKCLCHSLHLCASNACSELPTECEKLPHLIYNHFSSSSKRQFAYKEIQSILDLKTHKILRPAQTRWLSLGAVVERLLEQWDGLNLYFNNLYYEEECKKMNKKKKDASDQATTEENESEVAKILRYLQDPIIKLYFHFLLWILPKFTNLNKLFQSEKPLITAIYKKISLTYLDLLKTYMNNNYVNRTSINDVNPSNEKEFMNIHNIYVGIEAFNYFNNPEFTKSPLLEEKLKFLTSCRKFIIRGCEEIKKRFDFDDLVLKNLSIINAREAMDEKTLTTTPSLVPLMNKLPRLMDSSQAQIIDNEWRRFYTMKLPDNIKLDDSVDNFWHKILIYKDTEDVWSFKYLAKFFLNILSLPHANADCERIFSKIGLIKCQTRNKLVTNTLNGLLLSSQRINHNCVGYEPSKDEYNKMRTSLYTSSGNNNFNNNDNRNVNNNINNTVDDTLNVDLDYMSMSCFTQKDFA